MNTAFFSIGFRPFFTLGCIFGALSIGLWGYIWWRPFNFEPMGGMLFYHAHEMLMGFGGAIVFGFLLTAVQNWTAQVTAKSHLLGLLVISWLVARVLMLLPEASGHAFFVPMPIFLTAFIIARPIIKKRMWRNLFAPIILCLIAIINGVLLAQPQSGMSHTLFVMVVYLFVLLIALIAGRVIPFFTANRLGIAKPTTPKWVMPSLLIALLVVGLSELLLIAPLRLMALGLSAFSSIYCLYCWHHKRIWQEPMLWSLFVFYFCIPLGLTMQLVSEIGHLGLASQALHILTVGSIGGMILSMVVRVSLGHTGRKIEASLMVKIAFYCLLVAVCLRSFVGLFSDVWPYHIIFAAFFWFLAFLLIILQLLRPWFTPRL